MAQRKRKPTDRPADTAGENLIVDTRKSEVWEGVVYQLAHNRLPSGKPSKRPYWRAYYHDAQRGGTVSRYIGLEWRELHEDEF